MCRLSSGTGNLSEERMTSVFKDCCRLLSCLLVFSGLVSAWACLRVIGGPAGAVMGMTGSLSQRTPGDTHPLCALSLCTAFTEEWKRQVLQPVWSVWKQKTTADRDAVPCGSEVRVDTNMLIFLLYARLCGNIGAVVTFRLQEQMEAAIWSSQWSSRIFFCSQVHGNQTGESHLIVLHNVFSWSYRQIWWFEYLKTLFFHFGGFSSRTCSTSPVNVNIYVLFLHKALWPLCAQAVLNDVVTFVVSVLQSWNSTCMLIIKDLAPCPSQFNDNNCWGGGGLLVEHSCSHGGVSAKFVFTPFTHVFVRYHGQTPSPEVDQACSVESEVKPMEHVGADAQLDENDLNSVWELTNLRAEDSISETMRH